MASGDASTCVHVTHINRTSWQEISIARTTVKACQTCMEVSSQNALWLCISDGCLYAGCAENAHDHSNIHYKETHHQLSLNMTSLRLWCYECECEVYMDNNKPPLILRELAMDSNSIPPSPSPHDNNPPDDDDDDDILPDYEECVYSNDIDDLEDDANTRGITGLANLGNTCYMNSALQALSNCEPLTQFFLNCSVKNRKLSTLSLYYKDLLQELWGNSRQNYVSPNNVVLAIKQMHPMFSNYDQQDSQEFLRTFMDRIHEEIKFVPDVCSPRDPLKPLRSSSSSAANMSAPPPSVVLATPLRPIHSDGEYDTCASSNGDSALSLSSSPLSSVSGSPGSSKENLKLDIRQDVTARGPSDVTLRMSPCMSDSDLLLTTGHHTLHHSTSSAAASYRVLTERFEQLELNDPENVKTFRSIISDTFDGKLLSSVQCLTCEKVSSTKETFMDLSIPIPSKEQLNLVRYSSGSLVCGQNTKDIQRLENQSVGWMSWMYSWMTSWVWGPSITLQDCLAAFFSSDELKGENMYSCDNCKKLRNGLKYSRVLNLPEVLCIHLKRFRHDFTFTSKISSYVAFPLDNLDMKPYLHKDCKDKVTSYDLISMITHQGISGGGHYTCKALNYLNDQWYLFDDNRVTQVSRLQVEQSQSYVLFYRKQNDDMTAYRQKASQIHGHSVQEQSSNSLIRYYISKQWINKFNTFAEPGAISNNEFLCPHKGVAPEYWSEIKELTVVIPEHLWTYLHDRFGGGPVLNQLYQCKECKQDQDLLNARRSYELETFKKILKSSNQTTENEERFAICRIWYKKWETFVFNSANNEIPGAIDNRKIATSPKSLCSKLNDESDYVSFHVRNWRFLYSIYGGGPIITLDVAGKTSDSD